MAPSLDGPRTPAPRERSPQPCHILRLSGPVTLGCLHLLAACPSLDFPFEVKKARNRLREAVGSFLKSPQSWKERRERRGELVDCER